MGNCPLKNRLFGSQKKDLRKEIKKVSFKRDSQGFVTIQYLPNAATKQSVTVRPIVRQQPMRAPLSPKRYKRGKKLLQSTCNFYLKNFLIKKLTYSK